MRLLAVPTVSFASGGAAIRMRAGRLSSAESALHPPGEHAHDFFVITYVEHGDGLVRVRDADRQIEPGDVLALAPGERHDLSGVRAWRALEVCFMTDALTGMTGGAALPQPGDPRWGAFVRAVNDGARALSVPADRRKRFTSHLRELERELADQVPGYQAAARARLSLLLIEATRVALAELDDLLDPVDPVIADAVDLIEASFRRAITLDEVARTVGRSPSHLTRTMRSLTGRSVMQWVEHYRMAEARRLLLETGLKIDAVAAQIGYDDPAYFRRRFRRWHDLSPQSWRQLNR